ncbi:uncharacterized protein LOC17891648 [Capsella rubella]|uniref:uncharacterized protein LOC17891648 n=1 Tax=Capsella rubella TaxID=81985 RepID=UPI000CD4E969|nr:uncharacterized protein LOC17891648 [Capsella rubella]
MTASIWTRTLRRKPVFTGARSSKPRVFFVSTNKFPPFLWAGIATVPGMDDKLEEGLTVRQFLANMTCLCVDKYNKGKGFNVKFEQVLRANFNPGGPDAPLLEYQAKVVWSAGKIYPILCRPTPPSNIYGVLVEEVN